MRTLVKTEAFWCVVKEARRFGVSCDGGGLAYSQDATWGCRPRRGVFGVLSEEAIWFVVK